MFCLGFCSVGKWFMVDVSRDFRKLRKPNVKRNVVLLKELIFLHAGFSQKPLPLSCHSFCPKLLSANYVCCICSNAFQNFCYRGSKHYELLLRVLIWIYSICNMSYHSMYADERENTFGGKRVKKVSIFCLLCFVYDKLFWG